MYAIKIEKTASFVDENIEIAISGKPKEILCLKIQTSDLYSANGNIRQMEVGTKWYAEKEIFLDDKGIALMDAKIFTTLQIVKSKVSGLPQKLSEVAENRSSHYTLTLVKAGKEVARIEHERMFCDNTVDSVDICSKQLTARYFIKREMKEDIQKVPGIIVVSGSDGRIERAQAIAECFARRGFGAIAVCYFGMENVEKDLSRVPMEYIENAITYLKKRKEIDPNKIGIYGRSKGGEMVLLAATLFPKIKFVVANTPSIYVNQGLKTSGGLSPYSSWCYQSREIPFIKTPISAAIRLLWAFCLKKRFAFRHFYQAITWNKQDHLAARIKIEETNAKMLLLSSDTDAIWPSDLYAKEAVEIMKQASKGDNIQSYCYHNSGHMLTIPYQPIPNCEEYGGRLEEGVSATIDAWNKTIEFIDNYNH